MKPYAPIIAMVIVGTLFMVAGFKGCFRPKSAGPSPAFTNAISNMIQDVSSRVWRSNESTAIVTNTAFYDTSLNLSGLLTNPTPSEMVCRAALAGLAMGINRGNQGYSALSNEVWHIYLGKTNYP